MEEQPFVKVIYETDPIGSEKIILKLTTFDDSFDKIKQEYRAIEINRYNKNDLQWVQQLEENLNNIVELHYRREILRLKNEINDLKWWTSMISNEQKKERKKVKDIINGGDVYTDTVKGDVVNCKNVIVKEIYGDVVNCNVKKINDEINFREYSI